MAVGDGDFVLPGDIVGQCSHYTGKQGTYSRGGNLYASLVGNVTIQSPDTLSVTPLCPPVVVPQKGSVVLCRVLSITVIHAKVQILSVNNQALREPLKGIIRREDIRATEIDTVSVFNNFRPRDIVRARVLSLGDNQAYTLTTAENELGVVLATSSHDGHMTPISWSEMQCTITGTREKRKVAKVTNAISSS